MVDPLPPPPEPGGLTAKLKRHRRFYIAALKAARTMTEETIKALPGGAVLLGLLAGFESLAEAPDEAALNDRLDRLLGVGEQTQDDIAALTALAALMVSQQTLLLEQLRDTGVAPEPRRLDEAASAAALAAYRGRIAREFYYADYRGVAGITREEHAASLPFDHVYIQPRLLPERETTPLRERERDLLRQLEDDDLAPDEKRRAEEEYALLTGQRWIGHRKGPDEEAGLSIGEALADHRHAVILGGPGAGKSVLTRYLARTCALGPDTIAERLGWPDRPMPILLPLAAYATARATAASKREVPPSLRDCLDEHLRKLGGEALRQAMAAELDSGSALVLLDGVDEVPDQAARVAIVQAVDQFLHDNGAARCVVTSRPFGYIRLKGDLPHFQLAHFSPKQVETFVHNWQCCFERWRHPQAPNLAAAEAEARAMVAEIRRHPKVAELATNPLMLVIIALIRVEDKRLPEKRVELYHRAVNTLIDTWNRWRSQIDDGGTYLPREKMIEVWRAVALWTRREKPRSLVHRADLRRKLVELLEAKGLDEDDPEATAESYLNAAASRSGLLEERGQNIFAFWHPTFEEFLAAMELATPASRAADRLLALRDDPRWREVILLAVGYVGVVLNDRETATDITRALADDNPSALEPLFHEHLIPALRCFDSPWL